MQAKFVVQDSDYSRNDKTFVQKSANSIYFSSCAIGCIVKTEAFF